MKLSPDDFADDVIPRRMILRVLAGAIAFSVFLAAIAALLLQLDEHSFRPSSRFDERDLPAPHSTAAVRATPYQIPDDPSAQKERRALLDRWGWIDRDRQIARIPVDNAIDLLVEEGQ